MVFGFFVQVPGLLDLDVILPGHEVRKEGNVAAPRSKAEAEQKDLMLGQHLSDGTEE